MNRGTLCPKGSALVPDIVHAPTRLRNPRYPAPPGSAAFKDVSWDFALDRIARLMKEDRDKHFIAKNPERPSPSTAGPSTGMLAVFGVLEP